MKFSTFFLVLFLGFHLSFAQKTSKQINDFLETYHQYGKLNGAVLVADNKEILFKKGFGMADFDWQQPNTPQTRFRIASISKQFTALMILQLVEEGKLKLEDKISTFIAEYPKDKAEKITIHHLLSHTSGIVHYFPDFYQKFSKTQYTPEELMRLFWNIDLLFEPSTNYRYSSFGYVVLGVILEKVTGKNYETNLQERICKPLKMQNTGIDNDLNIISQKAKGYLASGNLVNCEYRNMSTVFATGQIYSTVEDLHLWHKALNTNQLLSEKYRNLLFTPNQNNYGYGWLMTSQELSKDKKVNTTWHTGGFNGFNAIILREENGYFVTILANAEPTEVENIAKGILQIVHKVPFELPKKSIAQTLAKTIENQGIEVGLTQYKQLQSTSPNDYDFAEGALIGLSEYFGMLKKTDIVLRLLEFNAEIYPNSSWTYSNLGSVYAQLGNEQKAVEYYEKTLALFPHDSVAKTYLENVKKKK
jgi:CubicO group peptidase (beta-lactamase class C family)